MIVMSESQCRLMPKPRFASTGPRTTDLRGRQCQSGSQARARISPSRRFKPVQLSPPSVLR